MNVFILIFSLLLIITYSYNPKDAIKYAKKYYKDYNPNYGKYVDNIVERNNFISQCLFAGGFSFSGCRGKDRYGMVPSYNDIVDCLDKKNWKYSKDKNPNFKLGNLIAKFDSRELYIPIDIKDNKIIYCTHATNSCSEEINISDVVFYYLEK